MKAGTIAVAAFFVSNDAVHARQGRLRALSDLNIDGAASPMSVAIEADTAFIGGNNADWSGGDWTGGSAKSAKSGESAGWSGGSAKSAKSGEWAGWTGGSAKSAKSGEWTGGSAKSGKSLGWGGWTGGSAKSAKSGEWAGWSGGSAKSAKSAKSGESAGSTGDAAKSAKSGEWAGWMGGSAKSAKSGDSAGWMGGHAKSAKSMESAESSSWSPPPAAGLLAQLTEAASASGVDLQAILELVGAAELVQAVDQHAGKEKPSSDAEWTCGWSDEAAFWTGAKAAKAQGGGWSSAKSAKSAKSQWGDHTPKGYDCESDAVNNMIVFGDSLTDVGNGNLSPECQQDGIFCGDRASNGPLIVDYIADKLCIDVTASFAGGNNFAVGADSASSGFADQVIAQQTPTTVIPPETLVFVWFGANDVRAALRELQDEAAAGMVITVAIAAMKSNIEALIAAGACSFLVLGAANVAHAPSVRLTAQYQGSAFYSGEALQDFIATFVGAAEEFSRLFNELLTLMLQGLDIPDGDSCLGVKYIDSIPLVEGVFDSDAYKSKFGVFDPAAAPTDLVCNFRFNNATTGATLPYDPLPSLPEDEIDFECENRPFYDELHLTTDFSKLIAESFLGDVEDFVKGSKRL